MGGEQQAQGTSVGTDDAVLSPLAAGNVDKARVYAHGCAVPAVVGGHEGTAAAFCDAFIEGVGIVFAEEAIVEVGGCAVAPVFVAVGQEVLHQGRCAPVVRMVALLSANVGHGEACRQEGVFAEAFLRASPAWIACQVGIGCTHHEGMVLAAGSLGVVAGFYGSLLAYLFYQAFIPGAAQAV